MKWIELIDKIKEKWGTKFLAVLILDVGVFYQVEQGTIVGWQGLISCVTVTLVYLYIRRLQEMDAPSARQSDKADSDTYIKKLVSRKDN